jgi:hypothetical protein
MVAGSFAAATRQRNAEEYADHPHQQANNDGARNDIAAPNEEVEYKDDDLSTH